LSIVQLRDSLILCSLAMLQFAHDLIERGHAISEFMDPRAGGRFSQAAEASAVDATLKARAPAAA
jgi:hypothetical protein